jgi:hypothetical protein
MRCWVGEARVVEDLGDEPGDGTAAELFDRENDGQILEVWKRCESESWRAGRTVVWKDYTSIHRVSLYLLDSFSIHAALTGALDCQVLE